MNFDQHFLEWLSIYSANNSHLTLTGQTQIAITTFVLNAMTRTRIGKKEAPCHTAGNANRHETYQSYFPSNLLVLPFLVNKNHVQTINQSIQPCFFGLKKMILTNLLRHQMHMSILLKPIQSKSVDNDNTLNHSKNFITFPQTLFHVRAFSITLIHYFQCYVQQIVH
jgi:hypothetical protein